MKDDRYRDDNGTGKYQVSMEDSGWIKRWISQSIWIGTMLMMSSCDISANWRNYLPIQTNYPNPNNSEQSKTQTAPSPAQSPAAAEMEAEVRQQINQIRKAQGLSELRQNDKLAEVARRYSQRMAEQDFFSHTSPDGDSSADRVQSAGIIYWIVGENLFKGVNIPEPVPSAVQGWMESPGHRANILRSEYRETGIGVWRKGNTYYFTQLFLRSFTP